MIERATHPGFALGALLAFLLAGYFGGPDNIFDRDTQRWMSELVPPAILSGASIITLLGGAPFTLMVAALGAISLLPRRQWRLAMILVAAVLAERALVELLKEWFATPRPPMGKALIDSLAYPSGHAANSMTAFLAVAILAVPTSFRRLAILAAVILSLAIGATRIILSLHWPTDVIGGWALGLATVATAVAIARKSGALSVESKHEVVGRHGNSLSEDETS